MGDRMGDSRFCPLWKISFEHPINSVATIHLSNKKNEMIELPIDSDNPNVANIGPNSAPTLPMATYGDLGNNLPSLIDEKKL